MGLLPDLILLCHHHLQYNPEVVRAADYIGVPNKDRTCDLKLYYPHLRLELSGELISQRHKVVNLMIGATSCQRKEFITDSHLKWTDVPRGSSHDMPDGNRERLDHMVTSAMAPSATRLWGSWKREDQQHIMMWTTYIPPSLYRKKRKTNSDKFTWLFSRFARPAPVLVSILLILWRWRARKTRK